MILKTKFVPVCMDDVKLNGWESIDIILITGDAYIDHSAFGVPLLARYLIDKGFKVGIISQPQKDEDYQVFGRPNLFFGISSGNVDSMVNHYTAQRKIRSDDDYSANNKTGLRPDRAIIIYTQKIKQFYKDVVTVIGGLEASLRRIPHYDFMTDKIRNSILIDSKASILVYGNGERQILEIANRLKNDETLMDIKGTCIYAKDKPDDALNLLDYKNVHLSENFYQMTKLFNETYSNKTLYYEYNSRYLIHYLPAEPLSVAELDAVYNLPFSREPHSIYKGRFIKAYEQIKFSILSHRGCYGGCSFCVIGLHQGKCIQSRSRTSIINEIKELSNKSYFKGTITDIAGPTANMYGTFCKLNIAPSCTKQSCLCPEICPNLVYNEKAYLSVLKSALSNTNIKNVFVSSGVRFDLALLQPDFSNELSFFYTSGAIKLAPEHVSETVLNRMNKPPIEKFLKFSDAFYENSKRIEKKQLINLYLIVGFPETTLEEALELAIFLKKNNLRVEQVQEFTPTPLSIATMSYYTGKDYKTGEQIHVPKGRELKLQKALSQWFVKSNKKLVIEALRLLNRMDLLNYFYELP